MSVWICFVFVVVVVFFGGRRGSCFVCDDVFISMPSVSLLVQYVMVCLWLWWSTRKNCAFYETREALIWPGYYHTLLLVLKRFLSWEFTVVEGRLVNVVWHDIKSGSWFLEGMTWHCMTLTITEGRLVPWGHEMTPLDRESCLGDITWHDAA